MNRPSTIHEAVTTLDHCLHARSIRGYSHGRSMAPGHKFFATVQVAGRPNINVHGDHPGTVLIEAARQAFDVHRGELAKPEPTTVSQHPPAPEVQSAPALTTRVAPAPTAPTAPVAPSFPLPPGC